MTLAEMIQHARICYTVNGVFSLGPDESINKVVDRERVPNARGVYLIFRSDDLNRPLYIGKAGTLKTDGSWKEQGLKKRMTMKQGGVLRNRFFRDLMTTKGYVGLTFLWFVTHDQNNNIIPAFAELEFLQAHYDQHGCLPELNGSA